MSNNTRFNFLILKEYHGSAERQINESVCVRKTPSGVIEVANRRILSVQYPCRRSFEACLDLGDLTFGLACVPSVL